MSSKIFSFGLGDLGGILTNSGATTKPVTHPLGGVVVQPRKSVVSDLSEKEDAVELGDFEVIKTPISKIVSSKESGPASFSTIFNDFDFEAVPTYNFWTKDEDTNENQDRGKRSLVDVPRYIKLKWKGAPLTTNPPKIMKKAPTTKRARTSSATIKKTSSVASTRGMSFNREDTKNFSINRKAVANGFISPGTLSAIVQLPLNNLSKAGNIIKSTPTIDEQLFLVSPSTEGISIHDIQANANLKFNGDLSITAQTENIKSDYVKSIKGDLFDGKFAINNTLSQNKSSNKSLSKNRTITIEGVASNSPTINMQINVAAQSSVGTRSNGTINPDLLNDIIGDTVKEMPQKENNTKEVEVFFNDPAITGLVDEQKIGLINRLEHAENVIGLAPYMQNVCMISELDAHIKKKKSIPSFPAIEEESGLEYVGYVIEKYKQDMNGAFIVTDEIEIPDRDCTEFIDTRVVYGGIYRYRIKSLLRWTRKANVSINGVEEDNVFNKDFTSSKSLATHKSSYFESEWSRNWSYAAVTDVVLPDPPDEFSIKPESHRKRIVITWKVPYNPQKDLYYYVLYRKVVDENKNDLSDWEKLDIFFGENNVIYFDNDIEFFDKSGLTYVYATQTVTRHDEYSKLSNQVGARVNSRSLEFGEHPVIHISCEGVDLNSIGAFSRIPAIKRREDVISQDKVMLTIRQGITRNPFMNNNYCLRVESLDTGEKKDYSIDVVYDNVKSESLEVTQQKLESEIRSASNNDSKIRDFIDAAASLGQSKVSDYKRYVVRKNKNIKLKGIIGTELSKLK